MAAHKEEELSKEEIKRALINRLSKIEGQINGLQRMIEADKPCSEILIQTNATKAALASFSYEVLNNNIRCCIEKRLETGDDKYIDELVWMMKRLR